MAEEQPVAAVRAYCATLLKEGSEWRNTGAGTDHDDWHRRISRQTKAVRLLHVHPERTSGWKTLREVGRCNTKSPSVADVIAHRINCQSNSSGRGFGRVLFLIEARLQRIERLDKRLRVGPNGGEFLNRGKHIERFCIPIRIFSG